jgi:GntR family transcriptional regulator
MTANGRRPLPRTEGVGAGPASGLPNLGTAALSAQALDALVRAIVAGSFDDGRLPAEYDLASQLGVSRTTVRSALQALEQIGIIERRPGRGTRVRKHARPDVLILHGLVAFSTLLRERGHEVTSQATVTRHEVCPPELAARLHCDVERESYEVEIRLAADGQPAVHIRERFCGGALASPLEDDVVPDSVLKLSATHFSVPIDHAVATLRPAVATKREQEMFGVRAGRPYQFMEEILYSADDVPLVFAEISVNDDYIQYAVMRHVP